MNAGLPIRKQVPGLEPSNADARMIRRSEVAGHVEQLIKPIRDLAESADLSYLAYLLDMAAEEANQVKDTLKKTG